MKQFTNESISDFVKEMSRLEEERMRSYTNKLIKRIYKETLPVEFVSVMDNERVETWLGGFLSCLYEMGQLDAMDIQIHMAYIESYLQSLEDVQAQKDEINWRA